MEKIALVHNQISDTYNQLTESGLNTMHKSMAEIFVRFSCISKQLEGRVKEHFVDESEVKKLSLDSLNELLSKWTASRNQAISLKEKLKEKKTALFEKKLVDQWQLSSDCKYTPQVLLNCKEVALREILPKETQEVQKHKNTYGYYSNKVKEEFMRISEKERKETAAKMKGVSMANEMDLKSIKGIIKEFTEGL